MKTSAVLDAVIYEGGKFYSKEASKLSENERKAILVEFINYFAMQYCVDLGMYACDLGARNERHDILDDYRQPVRNGLLKTLDKIKSVGICERVNLDSHMNDLAGYAEFSEGEAADYLAKFIDCAVPV